MTDAALKSVDGRRANSLGVRNRQQKVGTTEGAPWASWRTKSLPARAIKFIEAYCIPSKGHFAGKPLKVAPWQSDWLEEVLAPGIDSSALTLPRGNGKSTWTGAVATWATFDEAVAAEFGGKPDVPVVAPTLKQARKGVYGAAVDFRRNCPDLLDRSLLYTASGEERIVVPFNMAGELYPMAADPDTLQGLDPLVALVDEIGFIEVAAWDAMLLSGGKRPRSLILALGTRNPDDVPNALDHLIAQVEQHGHIDSFVLVDYSADPNASSTDREQWKRANPAIAAGYLRMSALESAQQLSPDAAFRTFKLNIKTGSQTGWLGAEGPTIWDATEGVVEFDADATVWLGVDKSAYSDSSAVLALQHVDDRWLIKARIFLPSPTVDHAAVRDCIRELCSAYRVAAVGYDDRYFVEGAQELLDEGLPMVQVPQTPARLVAPYSHLYRDFVDHRIVHEADPVFRAHVLGAVAKMDSSGGFTLAKGRSRTHIDAAVALGIARAVSSVEPAAPALDLDDTMLKVS